ncbi:MAG: sensor histidine kinase [Akkermansiaceae bacterium]
MFQIRNRLEKLAELIKQEEQALNALAPLQTAKQLDSFGYHSDYIPAVNGLPEEPLWKIKFGAGTNPTMAVVLLPAIDQRSSDLKGYAFPKRFRICSLDRFGNTNKVLVDWTTEDFPNPGMRPVYFSFPEGEMPTTQLLLEVFAGHEENGVEFFTLGRIHPIRQGEQQLTRIIAASSSYESAPYWGKKYLASQRQTLGMPLSATNVGGENLIMNLPSSHLDQPLIIRVELDKLEELGWINLFPGQNPDGIDVPGYGFPNSVKFYLLRKKNGSNDYRRRTPINEWSILGKYDNNMVRLPGSTRKLHALEIEFNDFPLYQEQAVFSLGEIEIIKGKKILSQGARVSLRGLDPEMNFDLGTLIDGKVSGQNILSLPDWFQQLAAGKSHESRLVMLKAERSLLKDRWQRISKRALIASVALTLTGILAFAWFMLQSRRKAENRLRRQIYADLHDEVGSNLGSISLMAGQLEGVARSDRMKAGMFDLALMTREACVSLREVVWLVDQKLIRLPALVQKLTERAERVLNGAEVTVEIPDDCPDEIISLPIKRHMIMFFKELIHNSARHAHATQVKFSVSEIQRPIRKIQITVSDNGRGFDTSKKLDGWGLGSMKQRAQEIGGHMDLSSTPAKGTTIVLTVPMSALSKEPNNSYKTSN